MGARGVSDAVAMQIDSRRVAEDFRPALRRWDLAELDAHGGTIYAVDADLRLGFMNQAWFRFAAANGGEPRISTEWPLGRSILECIPAPLRDFYEPAYRACFDAEEPWTHEYECSSPGRYRRYHQIVFALDDRRGLLVVNSLIVDRAYSVGGQSPTPTEASAYIDRDGLITQCSHCRRIQHASEVDRWDWIPEWVADFPLETSHGLCPVCTYFYYPVNR